jgi:alkanesulfonate monooxygenase SsuD/methylene tetrahydromethanopterin reductase-like flavin-dependent oxidoreductase (luciferase family)
MKFGLSLPNRGPFGDIHLIRDLAILAEETGWDGFFIWDHIASGVSPHIDPWIAMAAVACNTNKMQLGIHVTPISRRRPWKVAREIVTLDHLSNGRMVFGVGLGDFRRKEFEAFGEVADPRTKAEMLDEGLEIIHGLQSGESFRYSGKHYTISQTIFKPRPIQQPRVPIWVGGQWPNKAPFRRAARWDGVVPIAKGRKKDQFLSPTEVREMVAYIGKYRSVDKPFDICLCGVTAGRSLSKDKAIVEPYKDVGVTWWIDFIYTSRGSVKENEDRIRSGPPR